MSKGERLLSIRNKIKINKNALKNVILNILGYPNVIRRIQAPIILKMLELKKDDVVLDAGCGGGFFT